MKVKLLLTFALLLTAVTGAWADVTPRDGDVWDEATKTLTVNSNPDEYSYSGNDEIQQLVIASGVTTIGDHAFEYCTGLTSIEIPASVTSIGESTFYSCNGLTSVTFATGSQLTSIGYYAFEDCAGLTSITIPASVTSIGKGAFNYCNNLATMIVEDGNPEYDSRNSCNAIIEKSTNTLIAGCKSTTIPASVTSIGYFAFRGCTGLTSVTIPANVTSIGNSAFEYCTGLTSITIPASVASIDYGAFSYCSNLATMIVEDGNPEYDSRNGCNAIIEKSTNTLIAGCKNTIIPDDVTSIGDGAFIACSGLTTVTIPASVTYIGPDAFYDCTEVTDVYCDADPAALTWNENGCNDFKPDGSTIIHVADANSWYAKFGGVVNGIFRDSSPVTPIDWTYDSTTKTLTLSGTDLVLSYSDLDDCPWKEHVAEVENIVIEDGMKGIGPNAFADDYSALTSVTIPASVTFIGGGAFYACSNLTTVTFDGTPTLTFIGSAAFLNCTGLTSVTIPASVKSIGDWIFQDCSNLASVTLNSNPYIGYGAFYGIASDATVTMNLTAHEGATGEYWMTFYNDYYNFEADANTKVFTAELSDNSLTLTELKDDKIVPSGNAVILKSTSSPIVMTLTETDSNNDFSDNQLEGVYDPAGEKSDGNMYALNKGAQGVGFYKLADGSTLGYGKAYLWYDGSSSSSFFGFDGETTGVNEVRGQMEDVRGEYYDLQGRRVAQPAKGLYIVNGKKVVIK